MSETIIAALIAAGASLCVCLVTGHYQSKQAAKKEQENIELIVYRLDRLEEKVQAHNNLVDRMYQVEQRTEVQEEKIKVANNRIKNLEENARKDGAVLS